jgi:hypothetical protein
MEVISKHGEDDLDDEIDLIERKIPDNQKRKFEGYSIETFTALSMDMNTPSATDTLRIVSLTQ